MLTIEQRGHPLCIFGSPYSLGSTEALGVKAALMLSSQSVAFSNLVNAQCIGSLLIFQKAFSFSIAMILEW